MSSSNHSSSSKARTGDLSQGRTSGNSQHGDRGNSKFIDVHREWSKKDDGAGTRTDKSRQHEGQGRAGGMMERWQQESMLDQPYHNLKAVGLGGDRGNGKKAGAHKKDGSSTGYFQS